MGDFADLFQSQAQPAQGGGGTFRQAWAAPKAKADPRQSDTYKQMRGAAQDTTAATEKAVGDIPVVGGRILHQWDALQGAMAGIPFSDELIGLGTKGVASGVNLYRKATGSNEPQLDPEAAYLAGKDTAQAARAKAMQRTPVTSRAMEGATLLAGPGEAAAAVKGTGLLADLGAKAADVAPAALKAAGARAAALAARVAPAGSLARSAGSAGLLGGLYSAGEGEGLPQRLENARQGLMYGTLLGGATHVLAPEIVNLVKGAGDVGKGIADFLTKPFTAPAEDAALAPATAAQSEQAARAMTTQAARAGIKSPEDVARIAQAKFGGAEGVTAADILGSQGVTQLGAVARRAGQTGDVLRAKLAERMRQQGSAISQAAQEHLGVSPDQAGGDVDALLAQLQAKAGPLFDAATAGEHGVTSPELERLLNSSEGQKIAAQVQRLAQSAGKPTEGLTYGRVEVPEPATQVDPNAPPEAPPTVRRAPSAPPSQGLSLVDWLRRQGGVQDVGGEMAAMDAQGIGARSRMNPQELGALAQKAHEAGYFPEAQTGGITPESGGTYHAVSGDDLLAAIKDELSGRQTRFARPVDEAAQQRFEGANADEEAIYRGHTGQPDVTEADYGGTGINAPNYEPAMQESLTPKGWDLFRREANARVKYDKLTGQLVTQGPKGSMNKLRADFAGDVRRALAGDETGAGGALPGLHEALSTSSDKLRAAQVFQAMSGKLLNGDVRTFTRVWKSAKTPGDQAVARAALANDMKAAADRGLLRGGKFSTPGVQQKLEMAFGKQGAKDAVGDFLKAADAQAELARNANRMMPGVGSGTAEWTQALQAAGEEAPLETAGKVAGKAMTGDVPGALSEAVKARFGKIMAYRQTPGMPVQVLDEYGHLLMADPESFAAFLRSRNPADLKIVPGPAGAVGGALASKAVAQTGNSDRR